jgi:undecaprenyl-diphosphatase
VARDSRPEGSSRRFARPGWLARIGRHELGLLVAVALVAGGCWAFAKLGGAVRGGGTTAFDTWWLRIFRNPHDLHDALGPAAFEESVRDITALGSTTIVALIVFVALGVLFLERKYHAAVFVIVSVAGGMILSTVLKLGYARPRPIIVPHLVNVNTPSFPSGHSMISAVAYLTLGALFARVHARRAVKAFVLLVAATLVVAIGVSRVYLGVHYPTDVLAGWCAGATWASLCWLAARWLQSRGAVEAEGEGAALA